MKTVISVLVLVIGMCAAGYFLIPVLIEQKTAELGQKSEI